MLMLVIDEQREISKKEKYLLCLEGVGFPKEYSVILTARTLSEALSLIKKYENKECSIVINFVLIDQVLNCSEELKAFSRDFPGIIILKVESKDELLALDLLKQGIITEFYVETGNDEVDSQRLKEVFRIAMNKRKFNIATRKFEESLAKMEEKIG